MIVARIPPTTVPLLDVTGTMANPWRRSFNAMGVEGWAAPTGTTNVRTTFVTYTAPTVGAAYSQAQVQAIADALQDVSQRLATLIVDVKL